MSDITGNLDAKKACKEALKIHKKYLSKVVFVLYFSPFLNILVSLLDIFLSSCVCVRAHTCMCIEMYSNNKKRILKNDLFEVHATKILFLLMANMVQFDLK